jgi:hypothetical protein
VRTHKPLTIKGKETLKRYREEKHFDSKRQPILEANDYRCSVCGHQHEENQLTVHHKDRNGRGSSKPNNSDDNLELLCRSCHAKEHQEELSEARKNAYGNRWSRLYDCCVSCGTTSIKHNGGGLCKTCFSKAMREQGYKPNQQDKWSTKYAKCIECGSTESPHRSKGRCQRCYTREYNKQWRNKHK